MSPEARPSSLTAWLRQRSDEQLRELLRRRPDLALPAPTDLGTLSSRVSVRTSVQRAVDTLDAFTLRVLEAVSITPGHDRPSSIDRVASLLPQVARTELTAAITTLQTLALVWGDVDELYPVTAVLDAVGPYPAGLGRPAGTLLRSISDLTMAPMLRTLGLAPANQPNSAAAIREVLTTPSRLAALLAACTPIERELLDRMAAGPPIGSVRDALHPGAVAQAATPAHALIAHGLLLPIDSQTVELPREVGLALRADDPLGGVATRAPEVVTVERTPAELDRLATTAVLATINRVEALCTEWSNDPPTMLRSGGLGVRELRRTAKALNLDETATALTIEIAFAAGLLSNLNTAAPVYLPTVDYDPWLRAGPARQWTALATAWLTMTRQPSLVNQRDDRERLIATLGPDADRGTIASLRQQIMRTLAELAPGRAPTDRSAVLTRLAWQSPRRAGSQRRTIEAILDEADEIGMSAAGGITGYGRAILAGAESAAADALTIALPEPVDYFLLQPDLTMVVPGPPTSELARELSLTADLESTGGASVYRITESTVRRALDAGRSGADLTALFAQHSRTPVPQALSYLVDDVGRRHGLLRTGAASAYLRCDDDSLLSRVVSDRNVAALGLRRIAPTVVVTTAGITRILEVLRGAGYAPAAEAPDGAVLAVGDDPPRAPGRPPSRAVRVRTATDSETYLSELVKRVRAGDRLAELARTATPIGQQIPGVTTAATLGLLRGAIRAEQAIFLGYVDSHGTASQRTISPISMAGGMLRGHDLESGKLEAFALHHITAVSIIDDRPDGSSHE